MNKNSTKNLILGILVALLIGVGVYAYYQNNTNKDDNNGITPTSTVTGTETYIPPASEPGVPTVVTTAQAAPSISTVVVSGRVTPNGAQTTYWYEYGKTDALGTRTNAKAIGSGYVAISVPEYITGLSVNTKYYFRLGAQNKYGTVNGATYTFVTNNNPPPQAIMPKVETNAANSISRTTANLNGKVTPNNADTSYWFEYGETQDLGNLTAFRPVGGGSVAIPVSVTISNLNPLTKYYFRLNAQNQYGTVIGPTTVSFTTQGPSNPAAPSAKTDDATSVTVSSAVLNGRVSPNGTDTKYWFEYYPDSPFAGIMLLKTTPKQLATSDNTTVAASAKVEGLDANTKYTFRLVVENGYGTRYGNIVAFRTLPANR